MTSYFNKISGFILLFIFFVLFILTVYSLISSNEVVRDAELIQYIFIADLVFLLILFLYLAIFLINYIKYKNRDVIGLRLFNKFFLFFGMFSIVPSGIILFVSAVFFNIELSTWLGPAFKSTVNNSYQLAQKYIDQTERDLITDSKFIRNYVLAKRLIDRDIIQRFNISTLYNVINNEIYIEHFSDKEILLKEKNVQISSEFTNDDISIYFLNDQLFSKVKISDQNYLVLLKKIDLEALNYYKNIIESYNAINSIDDNKKNIQITFFTIYLILSCSLIIIFMIIGTNFSFKLARPIRNLNSAIISLKKGNFENNNIEKTTNKDDISQLTNSFYDMSETIIFQKNNLEKTNETIKDQLEFINNIIKSSPYGIFVINEDQLIFQNDSSEVFQTSKKSSYEVLLEILSNQIYEKKDFNKKSFEVNLTVKVNEVDRIFFIKSIFINNNSLFDQIIIFNDYTNLISAEKNNAIADLARKISHEIKNPLTPMLLSAEFIESQVTDEDLKNSILSIKRQIFLIQNLVNEFSTYARLPKANISSLNISEISQIYIEEYKKNYPNISFINKIDKNIIVDFDESYLDIIFNNLFKNSIEALIETTNPTIEIYLNKKDSNIKFTFFDNGPGYEGDLDNLTKPYFSTKNSSGLGLSLIKKIVKDNNGAMYIKSNKYSGFKVEINLYV